MLFEATGIFDLGGAALPSDFESREPARGLCHPILGYVGLCIELKKKTVGERARGLFILQPFFPSHFFPSAIFPRFFSFGNFSHGHLFLKPCNSILLFRKCLTLKHFNRDRFFYTILRTLLPNTPCLMHLNPVKVANAVIRKTLLF